MNSGVSGVDLSWDSVTLSDHYRVWEHSSPYFTPNLSGDTPLAQPIMPAYTHANSLGDPATNHYYTITSVNPCESSSTTSSRVGEFDFALVPGNS